MVLDADSAAREIQAQVAVPTGLNIRRAAIGILEIANASMANAIRAITADRGLDPRDFVLMAYGGAGPLHAADIADELGITRVVIPISPGHFSALGMLMSDYRRDFVRTELLNLADTSPEQLEEHFRGLEQQGVAAISRIGIGEDRLVFHRWADMRYVGQEHTVTVPILALISDAESQARIKKAFDDRHLQLYNHNAPDEAAEVVSLRVSVVAPIPKPKLKELSRGSGDPPARARRPSRQAIFNEMGEAVRCSVFDREELKAGNVIKGPAIIEEVASSTCVPDGWRVTVNAYGHLMMEFEG